MSVGSVASTVRAAPEGDVLIDRLSTDFRQSLTGWDA